MDGSFPDTLDSESSEIQRENIDKAIKALLRFLVNAFETEIRRYKPEFLYFHKTIQFVTDMVNPKLFEYIFNNFGKNIGDSANYFYLCFNRGRVEIDEIFRNPHKSQTDVKIPDIETRNEELYKYLSNVFGTALKNHFKKRAEEIPPTIAQGSYADIAHFLVGVPDSET